MHLHSQKNIKPCHYFNNEKSCPYNELGCKFLHIASEKCKFEQKCDRRLCPNRHGKTESIDSDIDSTTENTENSEMSEIEKTDFMTSTPKKRKFQCEECINESK